MAKSPPFIEWICHTYFSFLAASSSPDELITAAADYGYAGMGICDWDGVYGLARAHRYRQELPLFYGAELHLDADHHLPIAMQNNLVLVAQTHRGYHHLCQLINQSHHQKQSAVLSLDALTGTDVADLWAIVPMRGLVRRPSEAARMHAQLQHLKDLWGSQLVLAISRHRHPAEDAWISPTLALAKTYNLPTLLSQDVFFHTPDRKRLHDVVTAIRHNRTLDDVSAQLFPNAMRHLQPLQALHRLYRDLPNYTSALLQSQQMAESCVFGFDQLRYRYPKEWIPQHHTAMSYLTELTLEQAHARYGKHIPDKIAALLHHELDLVSQLSFADYFLTVYDIVKWARRQDILCQGRGSAANSLICFVLGITSVNPDQFDLLFERFISTERGDPPDIDVDFEHERREEVIQYIYQRYGRDKAAMVCNVITFRSRGALRAVGKAFGVPEPMLDEVSNLLTSRSFRRGNTAEVLSVLKQDRGFPSLPEPVWHHWAQMAQALCGFPRHLGIHSGGFMISEFPIAWLCAQEPATMPGRTVIQWCKEDIEGLGFFKIDILALGGLTLLKKAFALLQQHHNLTLRLDTLPPDDAATYAMIQRADTVGTFQIESRAQISFLPKHLPRNFYDLVVQIAIIRPGPIQGNMIHPYLQRRAGEEAITYPHPKLKSILERTFGVPLFQEQVMRIAMAVGDFTAGEANELRKSIGAFALRDMPNNWVEKLAVGMRKNGLSPTFIDQILGHIAGFASYGFPESHAASFAIIAYATSYLKCHYPAVFFSAILNALPMGFYPPDVLIKTAQAAGVTFHPICILRSTWDHQLENGGIRLGFRLVAGLSKSRIQTLITHRQQGLWPDLETALRHTRLTRTDVTALAAANAFAIWNIPRKSALWLAEAVPYVTLLEPPENEAIFASESPLDAVQLDYAATGTSLSHHPTYLIKKHAWDYEIPLERLVVAADMAKHKSGSRVWIFGMVTCRQSPPTAKGMVFVTLWDETGSLNVVIQPHTYLRYQTRIDHMPFLCVEATVQLNRGALSLLALFVADKHLPADNLLSLPQPQTASESDFRLEVRNYM